MSMYLYDRKTWPQMMNNGQPYVIYKLLEQEALVIHFNAK